MANKELPVNAIHAIIAENKKYSRMKLFSHHALSYFTNDEIERALDILEDENKIMSYHDAGVLWIKQGMSQ